MNASAITGLRGSLSTRLRTAASGARLVACSVLALAGAAVSVVGAEPPAAPKPAVTVIKAARLIDGTSDRAQ